MNPPNVTLDLPLSLDDLTIYNVAGLSACKIVQSLSLSGIHSGWQKCADRVGLLLYSLQRIAVRVYNIGGKQNSTPPQALTLASCVDHHRKGQPDRKLSSVELEMKICVRWRKKNFRNTENGTVTLTTEHPHCKKTTSDLVNMQHVSLQWPMWGLRFHCSMMGVLVNLQWHLVRWHTWKIYWVKKLRWKKGRSVLISQRNDTFDNESVTNQVVNDFTVEKINHVLFVVVKNRTLRQLLR